VIDAGHGGVDAGTVSPATGTPEKTVVLEMARTLAKRMEETGRYTVRLTRNADVFVPLGERVALARAAHADLFLSIHADAEYDHSVRGATVYTLAETASDAQAAALAAKENRSDSIAGLIVEDAKDEVSDILADLTRRETRRFSHAVARDILDEYRRNGRLVKGAALRQAGLKVLRAHDFPSVLVEIGFLSNKEDEALMMSPEWRDHSAKSLVAALDHWFAGHGKGATAGDDVTAGGGRAAASP
jgi:N-acetylmuramoyl-L-alanine amidase